MPGHAAQPHPLQPPQAPDRPGPPVCRHWRARHELQPGDFDDFQVFETAGSCHRQWPLTGRFCCFSSVVLLPSQPVAIFCSSDSSRVPRESADRVSPTNRPLLRCVRVRVECPVGSPAHPFPSPSPFPPRNAKLDARTPSRHVWSNRQRLVNRTCHVTR